MQQELLHKGKLEQAQRHTEARARQTSQRRFAFLDIFSTKIAISHIFTTFIVLYAPINALF